MSIPLENVPRQYARRDGRQWVMPLLALGADERGFVASLKGAVAVAERALGQTRRDAGPELLEPLFPQKLGGYRAARAVWACLMETYSFEQPALASVVGAGTAAELAVTGRGTPWELRRALFVRLGAGDGFVAPSRRAAALAELAHASRIADAGAVDEALWLDAPAAAVLTRHADPPDPAWLLARFRRRVLEALLFHATELRLRVPSGAGWRAAYRLAKALRLAVDPAPDGWVTVHPWASAVADRGAGARLADMALSLIVRHGARGQAAVTLNGRPYLLALDDATGAVLPRGEDPAPSYDSTVEEQLARDLVQLGASRRGWEVTREPPPLVAGQTVVLPDFLCRRGTLAVHLEVVGFWTEEYRERKLAKLRAVADALPGTRLALAVDGSLPGFGDAPFPVMTYRERIDAAGLLRFLEEQFDDMAERVAAARARLERIITDQHAAAWLLSPEAAQDAAGCYSAAELERVLDGWPLPAGAVWTAGVGLHGPAFLLAARAVVTAAVGENSGATLDEAAAALRERLGFGGDVAALVAAAGGFAVTWADVLTARVVRAN